MNCAGKRNKLLLCIVALAMIVCTFFTMSQPIIAYAAENEVKFDNTNVLDDLKSSRVNGKPFNIADYPFDESKDIQVINFVEYCYSYKANQRDNYGLYVYVYNPKGLNLSTNSKQNKIQMAVSYDAEGNATDYEKFSLEFCSKVESGDYKNLFYKFKIVDRKVNGTTFDQRVNSNARRYDVSGIELTKYGSSNATEYAVCGTYVFTGYSQGYGPDPGAKSTLDCSIDYLEAIELSVKHTFYRSQTSNLGAGYQKQLDTVYFSVPKRYIETYGTLQRIKAEWYEYKTNEILVTSNGNLYNALAPYIGVELGKTPNEFGMYDYVEDIGYSLGIGAGKAGDMYVAQWGYNLGTGYLHVPTNALYYMFLVNNIEEYDPYADTVSIGGVESNTLYEWIKNYNLSYNSGKLPIKDGNISADLFESDIDDSRKMNNENGVIQMGYSYYDFDADVDLQTLQSWSSTSPSFWDNWINFGLGAAFSGGPTEESKTVAPIQIIKASDLTGTDKEIAERLLVNINDVDSIKAEYNNAVTVTGTNDEEKVLVMFRFATSDYYAHDVDIIELNEGFLWTDKHTEGQAYIAQESVFLDFDIIQLTFNKEGDYTVIPAVSSPIDIVNDITTPTNMPSGVDYWKIIIALILGIILLVFFAPILPFIVRFAIWLVCLPFKAINNLFRSISKRRKQKREKEKIE